MRRYTATEVKDEFDDVLREVIRTGGPVLVEGGDVSTVVILSIDRYKELSRTNIFVTENQIELARAAFGMWAKREDIQDGWLEQRRRQWYSEWRDVQREDAE